MIYLLVLVLHILTHTEDVPGSCCTSSLILRSLYRMISWIDNYLVLKIVREKGIFLSFQNQRKGADFETEEHTCYTYVTLSEAARERMIYYFHSRISLFAD